MIRVWKGAANTAHDGASEVQFSDRPLAPID